ncbi:TRAP transporter small permease subunit [Achromobacter sp. GG226]|uniref:TRAP transporter small permease subunit n=1 Tax=Verticiella alkaliphila TaxID=2779529 RepID=UPI001C0C15B9|nr:TRAP transporter small permease subunit [Verticiella sp. GG226]MBU4612389.1 TRAP transporter small permease subunit [Verticiella sp. GG226]
MRILLALSRLIDAINQRVGQVVMWITLIVVFISAGNAVVRKVFHTSSNAWLEVQWYMFGAMFLLTAGYTLLRNEHVRVDILASRFTQRRQIYLELFGTLFFLLPMAVVILWLSWPMFMDSYVTNEQSSNSGGLVRWPVKLLIPAGFLLLVLAGVSHLIKCVAFLMGKGPDPRDKPEEKSAEERLAEEIAQEAIAREAALRAAGGPAPVQDSTRQGTR